MTASKIKKYYNKKAKKYKDWRRKSPCWAFLDTLKWRSISKEFFRKGKVLDAGGGEGRWSIKLAKKRHKVFLIDISEGLLKVAEENAKKHKVSNKIEILKQDIRKLPFPSNYFDYVLCEGDVLGLTPELNKALKELRRVLKKNGILYATFVNYYHCLFLNLQKSIKKYKEFRKNKIIKVGDVAFRTYTISKLKKLFSNNKLPIKKIKGEMSFTALLHANDDFKQLKNKKRYDTLLKLEKEMMEKEDCPAFGSHLIIIAKKQ